MSRNHKLRPISVLSVGTIGLSLGLFTPHALADEGTPAASTGVERTEKAKTLRRSSRQPLTRVASSPERITWRPLLQNYQSIQLRVTGPGIEPFEASFAEGEPVSFGFYDEEKALWADGLYKWELTANPKIPANTREVMDAIRSESAPIDVNNLLKDTGIVNEDQEMAQSGTFRIVEGKVVPPATDLELRRQQILSARAEAKGFAGDQDPLPNGVQLRDQVIADDLIVQNSIAVGQDANNGENFGFDTIRLKENNLRIKFDDTSNSGSFPNNDWQLTANDSTNGGANKFSIDDITSGRTPFTVEAGAPSNSLFVDDGGRVGLGTATPVVELHIPDGDTPTIRLEQDGSSGFTAQTWDVAGNETNFFVRDVTNGSKLPFKIRPNAPDNSLYIDTDGDVGLGDASPDAALDIESGDVLITAGNLTLNNGIATVTNADTTTQQRTLLQLTNNGQPTITYSDSSAGNEWETYVKTNDRFIINHTANAGFEFQLTSAGNLVTTGTVNGVSDRNAKTGIEPVDASAVLEKVAALPIAEWTYKKDTEGSRHMGPMAQDFRAQFGLGTDDKTIALTDMSGVALAAVKALHGAMEKKDKEIDELRSKTAELEARLKQVLEKLDKD
ncbi:MAG: tail fiber domain-containing protein [Verrucomicrobiae bacterium]|nr:tail fiber domain-containing protein [Verrucomicrobiae bacterium]